MEKISKDVAVIEFEKWLDFKRVKDTKRKDSEAQENEIVSAIASGNIIVEDDFTLTHKLEFPVQNDKGVVSLSELKYKPRIQVRQLNAKLKGVKADDADGRILAYAAALTGENTGMIGCLDTEDYRIASCIVMYFL